MAVSHSGSSGGDVEFRAHPAQAILGGVDELIEALLALNGDEVGDGVLVFATPRNERGLGDVELGGKAGERPALDAEVNETLNGFVFVHTVLSEPEIEAGGPPKGGTPNNQTGTVCGLPNAGRADVKGHSQGAPKARPAHTLLHRRRTKRNFGSSHTARPANTARRPREPRPRLTMSLPAKLHRTAAELTREYYDKQSGSPRNI